MTSPAREEDKMEQPSPSSPTSLTDTATLSRTQNRTAPRYYWIPVDVAIPSTKQLVAQDMDARTLKRFTLEGKQRLPNCNKTRNPRFNPVLELHPTGTRAPNAAAVLKLLRWMEDKKAESKPGSILPADCCENGNDDLCFVLEVYAACCALRTTFSLRPLEDWIDAKMREKPLTALEMAAVWELLATKRSVKQKGFGFVVHHPLVLAAVRYLTYQYNTGAISTEQNEALEDYFRAHEDLANLIVKEADKQRDAYFRKNSKGPA